MIDTPRRAFPIKTCTRREKQFLPLLRSLVAGSALRSHSNYVLESLGLDADASRVLLRLMEALKRMEPRFHLLAPQAGFVTADELNLLTTLRNAAANRWSADDHGHDAIFPLPPAVSRLIVEAGACLQRSAVQLSARSWIAAKTGARRPGRIFSSGAIAPPQQRHAATVVDNRMIAPHMRRVEFAGPALGRLSNALPAQWIKVIPFVEPAGRIYTIRKFDAARSVVAIDVVLRANGPFSNWLETARQGDACELEGSCGGFEGVPEDCARLLLAGDETALPAIASILESLSGEREVHTLIEVENPEYVVPLPFAHDARVQWLFRQAPMQRPGPRLKEALRAWSSRYPGAYVWTAGEAMQMREVRQVLLADPGSLARRVYTAGYWKRGAAAHLDAAAG